MKLTVLFFISMLIHAAFGQEKSLCYEISHPSCPIEKSYLFGTMHVMDESHFFFPKKLSKLLTKSKALCLEVKEISQVSIEPELLFDEAFSIKNHCTKNQWDSLADWSKHILLLNAEQFEANFAHAKPFMLLQFIVSTNLPMLRRSHEIELEKIAKSKKISLLELEDIRTQLELFDAIPIEGQMNLIFEELRDLEVSKDAFIHMQEVYSEQDLETLCNLAFSGVMKEYRGLFLDNRNKKWIPKMEKMMKQQSTFFAVGSGHLCGNYGLISLLENQGYLLKKMKL